jgi:predicted nucleotidyltransferase
VDIIAISGPDNVGKSTQLRLLVQRGDFVDTGPLDLHDSRWRSVRAAGLAAWWFESAPLMEVVDVLARSYLRRSVSHAGSTAGGPRRLVDRGMPMLEASVVATVGVREDLDYRSAVQRAAVLLAPYQPDLDHAEAVELGVLMLHFDEPGAGVARTLSREAEISARYTRYQQLLHAHLHQQNQAGRFAHTITVADQSILDVHASISAWLASHGVAIAPPALTRVDVVALGGLSESGKSTAGAYLQARHGYARLKIGYLLESAAIRRGIADIYDLDPVTMAELLIAGLEDYCAAHHFLRRLSIESLHRAGLAAQLAKLLGRRLTIAYLDADAPIRETRAVHGPDDLRQRDTVKTVRGAQYVRDLADLVLDNNGSRLALYHALDRLDADLRWPPAQPRHTTVANLRLPTHLADYLNDLLTRLTAIDQPPIALLTITGSGARGKYEQGWSDLDILIIAETEQLPTLRDTMAHVSDALHGVKLGCSVVSPAECTAGALTPRLLHTLRLIATGQLPVLYCADGLRLPHLDAETDAFTSLRDGVAAAVEIRRQLLRPTPEVRSLFKVTALLAKVALRADGYEHPDDIDALRALTTTNPDRFPEPADTDQARTDSTTAAALAVDVLHWWLATLPATPSAAGTSP